MKRQKPVPTLQPGGVQPYGSWSPSHPGLALDSMRRGTMLNGSHPADAMRMVQRSARGRRSLLESLIR